MSGSLNVSLGSKLHNVRNAANAATVRVTAQRRYKSIFGPLSATCGSKLHKFEGAATVQSKFALTARITLHRFIQVRCLFMRLFRSDRDLSGTLLREFV